VTLSVTMSGCRCHTTNRAHGCARVCRSCATRLQTVVTLLRSKVIFSVRLLRGVHLTDAAVRENIHPKRPATSKRTPSGRRPRRAALGGGGSRAAYRHRRRHRSPPRHVGRDAA
jgi:hypothetical protein